MHRVLVAPDVFCIQIIAESLDHMDMHTYADMCALPNAVIRIMIMQDLSLVCSEDSIIHKRYFASISAFLGLISS